MRGGGRGLEDNDAKTMRKRYENDMKTMQKLLRKPLVGEWQGTDSSSFTSIDDNGPECNGLGWSGIDWMGLDGIDWMKWARTRKRYENDDENDANGPVFQ